MLLDVDEVLRDFVGQLQRVYRSEFPEHVVKPITAWDLAQFFPIGKGIYPFAFEEHPQEIFGPVAPAYPGASEFVDELKLRGFRVQLATSQPNHATRIATLNWLDAHDIHFDALTFTSHKPDAHGQILVDDSMANLEDAALHGIRAIAFDKPWNQEWRGERAVSYEEVLSLVGYAI